MASKGPHKRSPPDVIKANTKKQKTTTDGRILVHPSEWFKRAVAKDLWMPDASTLLAIEKPRRPRRIRRQKTKRRFNRRRWRKKRRKRKQRVATENHLRVIESQRLVDPLLSSWFDVTNYTNVQRPMSWRSVRMPSFASVELHEDLRAVGELSEESKPSVNSIIKLRLYPTTTQREKLEHMFATNRAVYNKLVARSKEDCGKRLVLRGKENKNNRMTLGELAITYRPIAQTKTMSAYFRNKKMLRRHIQVQDEVRDSAFRDFKKAVKSSLALYFALKKKDKKTAYPELKFKSKFAPSNTIEIRSREVNVVCKGGLDFLRFHPTFFGFGKQDGIELREKLPVLRNSIRLQQLREGEYYIAIPRFVEFHPMQSSRVCAIDPGVRNFATVYDPDGRTFSVKDAHSVLKQRFDAIDAMKSKMARMDNDSKVKLQGKVRQRKKCKGIEKTKFHRQRYRLRRCIRFTYRHVTRMVRDMHHKLSSWLATNYNQVLLPSFQTNEMVRKYEKLVTADGPPVTSSDEVKQPPAQGGKREKRKREIRSSTARAMLAQSHYKFKMLLKYKMDRVGGRMIECEEEYTSKTCSGCGGIKDDLGGNSTYKCSLCHVVLDRDVNAAKNIFHKNIQTLC